MALDLYTSHTRTKKIGFEALKMGIDLFTSKYGTSSLSKHTSLPQVLLTNIF